jgi:hypothetical protein
MDYSPNKVKGGYLRGHGLIQAQWYIWFPSQRQARKGVGSCLHWKFQSKENNTKGVLGFGSFKPGKRHRMARKGTQGNRHKGKQNEASSSQGPVNRIKAARARMVGSRFKYLCLDGWVEIQVPLF